MATVVDSLVVLLNLDPSNFTEGQKKAIADLKKTEKAATQTAKNIDASGKKASQFFSSLKTEAIGLFAAFAGASTITQFAVSTVKSAAATGRLAKNLGVATDELSAWQGAVRQVGGTSEDANGSIQSLVTGLEQIKMTGNSPLIPYLQRLGISLSDLKNPTETLLTLAGRFHELDPKDAMFIGTGMGLSPSMINLLEQGRTAVERHLQAQRRAYVVTKALAENSEEAQEKFSLMRDTIAGVGATILNELLPPANEMESWLLGLQSAKIDPELSADLKAIGEDAREVANEFGGLWRDIHGGEAAKAFGDAMLKAVDGALKSVGHLGAALNDLVHGHFAAAGKEALAAGSSLLQGNLSLLGAVPAAAAASGAAVGRDKALLDAIAGTESPGYNVMYGGARFSSYADHPNVGHLITRGPNKGKVSTAAGRYQMLYSTWKEAQKALGLKDFSPENQDRAALWLAARDYKRKTGRNLEADLQSNDPARIAAIGRALHGTWTSLPGGIEQGQGSQRFASSVLGSRVSAASVAVPPAAGGGTTVQIDTINVQTQATDAAGMARDVRGALSRYPIVPQANTGLSG